MVHVSIVIPVYNVEAWLPACLDSVLGQTLRELEVICIDDASPDGCPAILDDYARRDPRVRVIHLPENHQQGYGRNRGLEAAQGKYVYFLDSDDMITPDAMEKLFTLAERDRLDGIFFDSQVLFESEELAKKNANYPDRRHGSYEDKVYTGQALFDAFIEQQEWTCYVQRQFWNRDFILRNDVWFPESTEHEDEFFPFKALLLAQRARYVPELFFIRRYRENSVMTRPAHPKDFHGYFINYCRMIDFVESAGLKSRSIDLNIVHMYERMLRFYPLFAAQQDPDAWFQTEAEKARYRFFDYSQKAKIYYEEKLRAFDVVIPKTCQIWIYGAGIIGKRAFETMVNNGYLVQGFLVTSKAGNPDILLGREVLPISDVTLDENSVVVIAVSSGYHDEMRTVAEEKGWRYCFYPNGR
ncbi:MAG: glycosyltransferase [Oscillospiraceae bacterium]|nr:glycosyltransferase [Oscillospiraceae bacterium]